MKNENALNQFSTRKIINIYYVKCQTNVFLNIGMSVVVGRVAGIWLKIHNSAILLIKIQKPFSKIGG